MSHYIVFTILILFLVPAHAFAHTIDSVSSYRIEIGWLNEPVVNGSSNAIELLISNLPEGTDPESVKFTDGVSGLHRDIKIEMIFKNESVKIPLSPDHDVPGRYLAFVTPTSSGYYQANLLGSIGDQPLSISMHPPKVNSNVHIQFPKIVESDMQKEPEPVLKDTDMYANITAYAGIGIGIAALAVAFIALRKK